jgi:hypothetical protein
MKNPEKRIMTVWKTGHFNAFAVSPHTQTLRWAVVCSLVKSAMEGRAETLPGLDRDGKVQSRELLGEGTTHSKQTIALEGKAWVKEEHPFHSWQPVTIPFFFNLHRAT